MTIDNQELQGAGNGIDFAVSDLSHVFFQQSIAEVDTMKKFILTMLFSLMLASAVQALTLTPGDEVYSGDETSTSAIEAYLLTLGIDIEELFKTDVGGGDSGLFADDYTTEFFNSPTDPQEATITWDGSPSDFISNAGYLLVKDGNQTPAWYVFDLNALGWDGMETIFLNDFWPSNGAISHVAIYGGQGGTTIPEPTTMILFGSGLVGLSGLARRKKK